MSTEEVTYDDLPALFRAADKASTVAQGQFAWLTATQLGLWVIAAILGSFSLSSTPYKIGLAIASAVILILTIVVTILILVSKFDRDWYQGRAIAESVRSKAWYYMTGSDPYNIDTKVPTEDMFISSLLSLLKERKEFASKLGGRVATEKQITDKMRKIRNLLLEDRKNVYLTERIDNQRRWYSSKAESSSKSVKMLFGAMIVSQVFALISAIVIVRWPESLVNLTGIFVNLAVAFLAWLQMKKHQDLAQLYGIAAQELNFIYEQSSQVGTEKELSTYVVNSENAISSEHKMWLTRRS
jgi:hypothetical protein